MSELATVEYVYGIDSTVHDDARYHQEPHVVEFRITKKTAKRVYYEINGRTRFVDRQRLEADGEVSRVGGWWESDLRVYLKPPVIEQAQPLTLTALKQVMLDAHPDRDTGSHQAFLDARARYEQARAEAGRTEGER